MDPPISLGSPSLYALVARRQSDSTDPRDPFTAGLDRQPAVDKAHDRTASPGEAEREAPESAIAASVANVLLIKIGWPPSLLGLPVRKSIAVLLPNASVCPTVTPGRTPRPARIQLFSGK